jgi:16S rRNA G966 N2-methylase RsmD
MAKKPATGPRPSTRTAKGAATAGRDASATKASAPLVSGAGARPSSLLDTRVIYCGDCLEQLKNLPARAVDLIYIDPPFNSNRNDDPRMLWGREERVRLTK